MGFGDEWVCHSIVHDRINLKYGTTLRLIDARIGTRLLDGIYPGHTICVKDRPSGKTRIEIVVKAGLNMRISDDGQYLAQADYIHKTLDLWNANPASRWPSAVIAGVLICILMMLFLISFTSAKPQTRLAENGNPSSTHRECGIASSRKNLDSR